ncbi:hypothetical protein IGI01_18885 [Bacillus thuringiensis]|nr:hypothetical protein [Bacillus thuringiensis]
MFMTTIRNVVEEKKKPVKDACLFYGYPTSINNTWSVDGAVDFFKQYDILVLGDQYQHPSHEEYQNTVSVVTKLRKEKPSLEIFGYVPLGQIEPSTRLTVEQFKAYVDEWATVGATGIFIDEYGYDYKVTRELQNDVVNHIHSKGMNCIANSWNIDWVFRPSNVYLDWIDFNGNPNKVPAVINEKDYVMFENMFYYQNDSGKQVVNDQLRVYEAVRYLQEKQPDLGNKTYREVFGTQTFALDCVMKKNQTYFTNGYIGSVVLGIDAFSVSPKKWGADTPKYETYKKPSIPISTSKSVVATNYDGVKNAKFSKVVEGDTLDLYWKPDAKSAENVNKGVHQVTVNDKPVDAEIGTTLQRPTIAPTGFQYYDTTIKKPIWKNDLKWYDAVGVEV